MERDAISMQFRCSVSIPMMAVTLVNGDPHVRAAINVFLWVCSVGHQGKKGAPGGMFDSPFLRKMRVRPPNTPLKTPTKASSSRGDSDAA